MAVKHRLRMRDLREIYLLVGDCCEVGADPLLWRMQLVERLREILRASTATVAEVDPPGLRCQIAWHRQLMDIRWKTKLLPRKSARARACQRQAERSTSLSIFSPGSDIPVMKSRRDVTDAQGFPDRFVAECLNTASRDDTTISYRFCAPNGFHVISLARSPFSRPFHRRDRKLLRLFHREIQDRMGTKLAALDQPSALELSPRMREVLDGLLSGGNETQVANDLCISPHTVHEHVKRLHAHYGVSSRAELLARTSFLLSNVG